MYGPNAAPVTYHRHTELRAGLWKDVSSPASDYGISRNLHHTSRKKSLLLNNMVYKGLRSDGFISGQ